MKIVGYTQPQTVAAQKTEKPKDGGSKEAEKKDNQQKPKDGKK